MVVVELGEIFVLIKCLIDCYNFLFADMPQDLAGLDELTLAGILSGSGFCEVVLVCDGDPKPGVPSGELCAGVRAVYSGKRRTADSVLIEMLRKHSAPRSLTVVSSDNEILKAAFARKARGVTSQGFIREVHRLQGGGKKKEGGGGKPRGGLSEGQVDGWLKAFGIDEE